MPAPSPTPHEPRRRPRWALAGAATLVGLLLAEGALRLYSPEVGTLRRLVVPVEDDRGFAPRAGIRLAFDGVFSPLSQTVVWQTNAQGFRDDREIGSRGQHYRIATYGDSETFGWAVPLDDTFQRRMEAIDPRVQVLNFGVPGYNVTNVREQLERTVPELRPDLALYLVNKNDFNEPVHFTPLSHSDLLLRIRFLWHFTIGKKLRRWKRDSRERVETFAREVDRMTRFLEARDTPFILAFLKWKNRRSVWEYRSASDLAMADGSRPVAGAARRFERRLVNAYEIVRGEPKEDTHYAASAHRKMAALFCRVVSEGRAGSCVPPDWQRDSLALGVGPPPPAFTAAR